MIGVVVSESGLVREKRAMFGDDAKSTALTLAEAAKNPGKKFDIYPEARWAEFEAIVVEKSDDVKLWESLKPTASPTEVLFAKLLGLDNG